MTAFKRLKILNLSCNGLLKLPKDGLELPLLEEFYCVGGRLPCLQAYMLKWARLSKLNIRNNQIVSLFDEETEAKVITERLGWPHLKYL